jgi:hypothetical protein
MKHSRLIMAALMASLMLLGWNGVLAQDDPAKPPEIPPPSDESSNGQVKEPPIPPKVQDEQLEPTVTIREEEDRLIEEFRRNGQVYMVKITPKGGIPYYYIDTDGDGQLELDEPSRAMNPVQPVFWKIKEWK